MIVGIVLRFFENICGFFFWEVGWGGRFLMNLYSLDVNYYFMIVNFWVKDGR